MPGDEPVSKINSRRCPRADRHRVRSQGSSVAAAPGHPRKIGPTGRRHSEALTQSVAQPELPAQISAGWIADVSAARFF